MSNRIGIGIDVFGAGIDADATTIYNRIIADSGVSDLTRLNFFVKGLKTIYGSLVNVPVCYDAHWIGYKLGSGTGATAGQAAAKLYSLTVAGDAVQTTAASQPLLLAHNGASSDNYWWGSNVVANNITTPNKITSGYNGEFEIQVKIKTIDTTKAYPTIFVAGTNASLGLLLKGAGTNKTLALWRNGGVIAETTATINTATFNSWIKAYRTATNVRYETSTDGITWTLFENVIIANIAFTITGGSMIGNYDNGDANGQFVGNIYRILVWINGSSSTGTLTYDFNPATYNASTSQTNWTSVTGEVWTINTGTATTGYKGVLVDRTIVQSDGVDDTLTNTDTTTFRTTFAAVSVNRTGAFFAGILNNNTGASALSQWMYTQESTNIIDANPVFTPTKYVNNVATSTYITFRTFIGQIDLGLTPNTANGRIIGFLGGNNYLLGNIKTILQTTNNPNATERTATYNLLKTLNNL